MNEVADFAVYDLCFRHFDEVLHVNSDFPALIAVTTMHARKLQLALWPVWCIMTRWRLKLVVTTGHAASAFAQNAQEWTKMCANQHRRGYLSMGNWE